MCKESTASGRSCLLQFGGFFPETHVIPFDSHEVRKSCALCSIISSACRDESAPELITERMIAVACMSALCLTLIVSYKCIAVVK